MSIPKACIDTDAGQVTYRSVLCFGGPFDPEGMLKTNLDNIEGGGV
jgi:hypothetical protein